MPMLGCKGLKQSPSGLSPSYHLHNFFAENLFVQVIAMCSFLLKFNSISIIFFYEPYSLSSASTGVFSAKALLSNVESSS